MIFVNKKIFLLLLTFSITGAISKSSHAFWVSSGGCFEINPYLAGDCTYNYFKNVYSDYGFQVERREIYKQEEIQYTLPLRFYAPHTDWGWGVHPIKYTNTVFVTANINEINSELPILDLGVLEGEQCPKEGNPITPATGNKFEKHTISVNSTYKLNLYYNSLSRDSGELGYKWSYAQGRSLSIHVDYAENHTSISEGTVTGGRTFSALSSDICHLSWYNIRQHSSASWVESATSVREGNHCKITDRSGITRMYLPIRSIYDGRLMSMDPFRKEGPDKIIAHRSDGRAIHFINTNGNWKSTSGANERIEVFYDNSDTVSGYQLHLSDNSIEKYDSEGRIQQSIDANGIDETFVYDEGGRLTNAYKQNTQIILGYDHRNRISTLSSSGRTWQFEYDPYNNLKQIFHPDGTYKTFHYEDARFPNHLTGVTDERTIRYSTFEYDNNGLAISTSHAGEIERVDLNYISDSIKKATNSLGKTTTYRYKTLLGVPRISSVEGACSACGIPEGTTIYSYDAKARITALVTNGLRTEYGNYDRNGNYGYKIEAAGTADARRTDYTYDARFISKVATVTEPSIFTGAHKVTTYDYDEAGNTTQIIIEGFTIDGQPVSRIVNMSYNGPFKQLTAIDGPRSDVDDITTLHYYPNDPAQGHNRARLQKVVDANGVAVRDNIQYSATGKVLSEQRPNGLTLNYEYYPGNDRLKKVTQSDGQDQRHTYWTYLATGEVETITSAYGTSEASTITFGYDDARRLVNVSDDAGNRFVYTLDTEGNLLKQQTFDADNKLTQTLSQTFDSYSRLKTRIGADNQTTQYDYNSQGLLERETDARNHVTEYGYDDLQRLTNVSAELGSTSSYVYDVQDNLTQVTDPNGNSTAYQYDDLGNLRQQTSPDTGVTQYHYDAAGNLTQQVDAKGQSTSYAYDALNRITTITYDDGSVTTYGYDQGDSGYGRLANITTSDNRIDYHYNAFGEVVVIDHTMHGKTFTLSHLYNTAGQVKQTTYPSGMVIDYRYAHGKVSAIEIDGQPLLEAIRYQPFSAVAGWQWGNGQLHARSYNLDGQLSSYDLAGKVYTLLYDAVGNLKQRSSNSSLSDYDYDALNRLATESGDHARSYLYDTNGNRTQLTEGGNVSTYLYNSHNNQLTDILGQLNQRYQYDANGNLIDDGQFQYHYDARNRLININNQTHYQHNGLGQRISKQGRGFAPGDANGDNAYSRADVDAIVSQLLMQDSASGNADCNEDGHITIFDVVCVNTKISANETPLAGQRSTLFVYDLNGQLIGEYDDQGNTIQETIYLGNMPVATTKNSNIYYVHSDHLNTPRLITDQTHTPLWAWDSEAFGTTAANEDVDGDGVGFEFNLRFPGQYYDVETGLHYNYFRDYDPATGRYLQSDPAGITYSSFNPAHHVSIKLGIKLLPDTSNLGLNHLYGYTGQNPTKYIDIFGLWPSSCGPGHIYCNFPELIGEVTKQSLSHAFKNSRLIASRRDIQKVDELCDKFGGKPRDWKKKAGIDDKGREWHWYEKHGEKFGLKPQGAHDPF